jgi:hypothetical protein
MAVRGLVSSPPATLATLGMYRFRNLVAGQLQCRILRGLWVLPGPYTLTR